MLTEPIKQEIRDVLARISEALPGYKSRPAQRVMIAEVAKILAQVREGDQPKGRDGEGLGILQCGTGVGKSISYLTAALVLAKHKRKTVVISTSTIALQEQLMYRDIPFFLKAAGLAVTPVLAKGRSRYVCRLRLQRVLHGKALRALLNNEGEPAPTIDDTSLTTMAEMHKRLQNASWDGDRDLFDTSLPDASWQSITTDSSGCLGRNCAHVRNCAQLNARKSVKESPLVVANHDLVLADLAMGGGMVLPAPANTIYIFDEGDTLTTKAVDSFACQHPVSHAARTMSRLAVAHADLKLALERSHHFMVDKVCDDADSAATALIHIGHFFGQLSALKPQGPHAPSLEFKDDCLPEGMHELGQTILTASESLTENLSALHTAISEAAGESPSDQTIKLLSDLFRYIGEADALASTWSLLLSESASAAHPPVAKWVTFETRGRQGEFILHASPVIAAAKLRESLWSKAAGAIITSATITALGSFRDYLLRSGLDAYDVPCHDLPSPFEYETQGTIVIPQIPGPKNYEAHTRAVTQALEKELQAMAAEGLLVIFTSRRQLEDVTGRLPDELKTRVLVQGSDTKSNLIARHRATIDAGRPSVIFGLDSFSTGVDLPGKYCTTVVVARLPFAVPDNPVANTLNRWVEARGGDPFMELSVPEAGRKLQQIVGRLIRTETDSGRILCLDPRLWNSDFGRQILNGLPPFRISAGPAR